ncbi:hypothetical protein L4X63_09680 [Geomonas sp. Red32]|uniref:hypothetical protein n=1 Tax=Geomonas sp. Red32 TaxID=2912856 RepID=UPI00202CBDCA|nr:hypothetical protein [Geomonas sp. Red32]MCM0081859.1 hypothetical protein [Geomonas sp. Red32]
MKSFFATVLRIDLGALAIVVIVRLQTKHDLGTIMVWCGFLMLIIGSCAALGGWDVAPGEYDLRLDQKFPQGNFVRSPEKWSEMHKSYDFCLYLAAASLPLIIIGYLL